jgi:HD-GYP domain-containing protein (c-di-GMP phosphodiesterase class II)
MFKNSTVQRLWQRLLAEASAVLVASLDHQITLHAIAHLLVPALADYCRIAIVDEHHQIKDIAVHHIDSEKNALVQELYDHYKDHTTSTYGVQKLLASSTPELISEVSGSVLEAEAVRTAVAAHTFRVGGGIHLTCSLGLASYPLHALERDGLLTAADRAMYAAKHFGRNQVHVAHDPAVLALFAASHPEGGREETALVGVVEALVALVEARDHLTGQHSHQVAALVLQLTMALGWSASEAQMLALAGQLHDIGKVAIPETILQKPAALTTEEWGVMRTHPVVGADVVSHIPALRPLAPIIRAHHERWDGRGYPDQLAGEAIPVGARILTAVDAYLTMIVDRPYRRAYTSAAAVAELRSCAGSQFDPQVVDVLLSLLRQRDERTLAIVE